jgi:hypothetical protein
VKRRHAQRGGGEMSFDLNPTYYTQFARFCEMLPEGAKSVLALLKLLLDFVLSIFTLPLEVLLLARWGSRALSLYQVTQVTGLALIALIIRDPFLTMFFVAGGGAAWWRYVEARRGEWVRKPYRYSYTPGEPVVWFAVARFLISKGVPRGLFTDASVFRVWEPATGLLAGVPLLLLPFTRFLGFALVAISFAFFVKRHVMYMRMVEMWRDKADAEAVGQAMTEDAVEVLETVHVVRLAPVPVVPVVVTKPHGPGPVKPPKPPLSPVLTPAEPIRVVCGVCMSRIKCPVDRAGQTLPCPKCNGDLRVPAA